MALKYYLYYLLKCWVYLVPLNFALEVMSHSPHPALPVLTEYEKNSVDF